MGAITVVFGCKYSGNLGKYSGFWVQYLVKNSGIYGKFSDIYSKFSGILGKYCGDEANTMVVEANSVILG